MSTPVTEPANAAGVLRFVPLDELHDSPTQQRDVYDPAYIAELGASIKAAGQNNSPVLARPHPSGHGLEIVFGHCRKRGCAWAGLAMAWTEIRDMTDLQVELAQISENLNRRNIDPLAEARGFHALMQNHGIKPDQLKEQFGKSRSYVYASLSLLKLCDAVVTAMGNGLPVGVAHKIASYCSDSLQQRALQRVRSNDGTWISERDAKKLLNNEFTIRLELAPFDLKDEKLLKRAGSCAECPNCAANNPELADLPADTCVDRDCYDIKVEEHWQHIIMQLQDDGHTVLQDDDAIREFKHAGTTPLTVTYRFGDKQFKVSEMIAAWPEDHPRATLTYVAPNGEEPRGYIKNADLNALMVALKLIPATPPAPAPAAAAPSTPKAAWPKEDGEEEEEEESTAAKEAKVHWPFPTGCPTTRTVEQIAVLDRWDGQILPAILRAAAAQTRTTDDLRLVAANVIDYAREKGVLVAAELLGWPEQTIENAEEWLRRKLPEFTADQLGTLIVLLGIACDAPGSGNTQMDGRIELAKRYGVGLVDTPPEGTADADLYEDEDDDQVTAPAAKTIPSSRPAKYRNAATGETWSGRGLQPKWLKAAIAAGGALNDFVVQGATA